MIIDCHQTLAMETVCCSMTSWMAVRSLSIILSNSSMQHTPWSASTSAPPSSVISPVTGSCITAAVRPTPDDPRPVVYWPGRGGEIDKSSLQGPIDRGGIIYKQRSRGLFSGAYRQRGNYLQTEIEGVICRGLSIDRGGNYLQTEIEGVICRGLSIDRGGIYLQTEIEGVICRGLSIDRGGIIYKQRSRGLFAGAYL